MNRIELTNEERDLLVQVVERRERDLEVEILHTDYAEFRRMLRSRLALLGQLHKKLLTPPVALAA